MYEDPTWDTGQPDWHRGVIGGLWDEIGRLQLDFLRERGLRPDQYLVDVGCGSLRGGVHLVRYLDRGHYFGVDRHQSLLDAGRTVELPRYGLTDKAPTLVAMADFDLPSLGRTFDVGIGISLFTHLPLNSILRCLLNVDRVLVPGGVFYATFFEDARAARSVEPITWSGPDGWTAQTTIDSDPYHYGVETCRALCHGTGLSLEYIGDWGHPRGQRMLAFHKVGQR